MNSFTESERQRSAALPLCYFPGSSIPVPPVMTEEDVIRLLRLDETGTKHPGRTLESYRKKGLLRAVQVGRLLRYRLVDVLAFVELKREVTPR